MEFVPKNVESPRGLSQEEALRGLQEHPQFKAGSRISSIRPHGDRWFIRVLEPKVADFPPKDDDEEEESSDEGPELEVKPGEGDSEGDSEDSSDDSDDSDDSDSPFPPKPEGEGDEPKVEAKGELGEVLALLHKVVEALGIGGPDGLGPEGPPGKPPVGPPPGAGAPPAGGPPGGAPGHGGARPGAGRPPAGRALRDVPPGASPISGFASVEEAAKHIPSFTAASEEGTELSVKEAKADLEKLYGPSYKVKQIQRKGGRLSALLSVR